MFSTMPVAPQRIGTPMGFLAEQELLKFQWPASFDDVTAWQTTASILQNKMRVTLRFTSERLIPIQSDTELYFALCEAKHTASVAHALAVQLRLFGRWMSTNKFQSKASALRAQCDNLKGSIKQIFSLLDEGALAGRVDRAM